MSENIPQSEFDARFKTIVADLQVTIPDIADREEQGNESTFIATIMDHWRHLKEQGYSDEEIRDIFDLFITEEGMHEI